MNDTQYFQQALDEFIQKYGHRLLGDITTGELSKILMRAQQIKAAHREELASVLK